jgi:hypothetical protein
VKDSFSFCPVLVLLSVVFGAGCYQSSQDQSGQNSSANTLANTVTSTASNPASSAHAPVDSRSAAIDTDDWFETVTSLSGVDFSYRNGDEAQRMTLLETLGGGAGVIDFDGDGDQDLFCTGGGTISQSDGSVLGLPPSLWENLGDFKFRRVYGLAGFHASRLYTHGCAVADFNRDGFSDLVVAGYGGVLLYLNLGDGTFSEVAEVSGLNAEGWCTALAWNDFDRDGLNDLFIARYVDWTPSTNRICESPLERTKQACGPMTYSSTTSLLYNNLGDGSFQDVSAKEGLSKKANGLGVVAADFNGDSRCEYYVASDLTENLYYAPSEQGGFEERSQMAGVATNDIGNPEGSMGIAVGDYDGNGSPDLFVTNFEGEDNSLYRNLGEGMFLHVSNPAGLFGLSRMKVGFGTMLTDFDGDGWPDIIVANGHVNAHGGRSGYRQSPQLFRNQAGRRFQDVSTQGGPYFRREHHGRGVVVADLNDDGAPDVVVVHQNEPVEILRNRRLPSRYVSLRLCGTMSNAEAIGARVQITDGDRAVSQWVTSGTSYFSQSDYRLLFALQSSAESVTVSVHWPTGHTEQFASLSVNRTHDLFEGKGTSKTNQQ